MAGEVRGLCWPPKTCLLAPEPQSQRGADAARNLGCTYCAAWRGSLSMTLLAAVAGWWDVGAMSRQASLLRLLQLHQPAACSLPQPLAGAHPSPVRMPAVVGAGLRPELAVTLPLSLGICAVAGGGSRRGGGWCWDCKAWRVWGSWAALGLSRGCDGSAVCSWLMGDEAGGDNTAAARQLWLRPV